MAFKINYDTLPSAYSTDPKSVGYYVKKNYFSNNPSSSAWNKLNNSMDNSIDLLAGVYYVTANISYKYAPNASAFIALNNDTNGSIWFDTNYTYQPLSSYNTYQDIIDNASWTNIDSSNNWFPVAGQQLRNGTINATNSTTLSLSCTIQITNSAKVQCIYYVQGASNNNLPVCATLTCTRIA